MTQVGESVTVALIIDSNEQVKCEFQPPEYTWKCTLDGDSGRLAQNITTHRGVAKPGVPAKLADVTNDRWPSQAHHLIPWQQLEDHQVTQWLTKDKGKLYSHNGYSVDHGKNGKFMPYVSDLPEWSGASTARKREIAEEVMGRARIQLHQGPHSYKPYGVGEEGYKTRVEEYLAKIHKTARDHYAAEPPCEDCKSKSQAGKFPPRRNAVRAMDQASLNLELDINAGRIFVSRRAAEFVAAGGAVGDAAP